MQRSSMTKKQKLSRKCNNYLRKKIKKNMREFNLGKGPKSRKQAIAIAYAQTKKRFKKCKKVFEY